MDFSKFKDWALLGLISSGVYILHDLKTSVETLNVSVAVTIEKLGGHEKRIEKLEDNVIK